MGRTGTQLVTLLLTLAACSVRSDLTTRCTANTECVTGVCVQGVCIGISCDEDSSWDASTLACARCPEGTVSEGGTLTVCRPIDCTLDTAWDVDVRACVACPPGTVGRGGDASTCESIGCNAEERWDPLLRECLACPDGTTSAGGATTTCTPIDCAPNELWNPSTRACLECGELAVSAGGDVQVCTPADCPRDHRWDRGSRTCRRCFADEFSEGGAVVACTAIACAPGRFWDSDGRRCVACPGETTSPGGPVRACSPDCRAGRRWDELVAACVDCAAGTNSPGGPVAVCTPDCATDQRWDELLVACVDCPVGSRSFGGEAVECIEVTCLATERYEAATGLCVACVKGEASSGGRDESCEDVDECLVPGVCGAGTVCVDLPGGHRCDCAPGTFGSDGDCRTTLAVATDFVPTDYDVDAAGAPVVVGLSGGAVVARRMSAGGVALGGDVEVRAANGKPVLKGPWVTRARGSGRFVVASQQYADSADVASREDRLDLFAADGTRTATVVLPSDDQSSEVAVDEAGVFAIATRDVLRSGSNYSWAGPLLTLLAPDGATVATLDVDFCRAAPASDHAVHLALHPTNGTGVVSCQGHSQFPIRWRRFRTDGTWLDAAATTVTSASSWYDTHLVALTEAGGVVLLWADHLGKTQRAAFYGADGTKRTEVVVAANAAGHYDTFRRRHVRPLLVGGDLLLPYFADDGTGTFKFNALARFDAAGVRLDTLSPAGVDTGTLAWTPTVLWSRTSTGLVRDPLWVAP